MTDYNDGNWHGWNGGECPVHPKTVVEAIFDDGSGSGYPGPADCYIWDRWHPIAFRVVKPYREPREGWVAATIFESARQAKIAYPGRNPIKVREVIE